MGGLFSKLWRSLSGSKKSVRVLMAGLDNAGKTTILYRLKIGESLATIPTIGFNLETIEFERSSLAMWDVGGQESIRALWKHYYDNSQAVVFVVDSSDPSRLSGSPTCAKEELLKLMNEPALQDVPLLVLANKQDHSDAYTTKQCSQILQLDSIRQPHFIAGTVATTGEGLEQGLAWLVRQF